MCSDFEVLQACSELVSQLLNIVSSMRGLHLDIADMFKL